MIKKKDNSNRFVIDFRDLNKITVFDAEPIPDIELIYCRLAGHQIYSSFDLTKGFWQVPLSEGAKDMTSFQTPLGSMRFRVMPFGLVNASQTFSRLMRRLLQGLDHLDNFIDDVILYNHQWREHVQNLERFLQRLFEHNLTARPTKCHIGYGQIECLGHLVGKTSITPIAGKLDSIRKVPSPVTKKQVRSFLGLTGYYRKFVPNYAAIAHPLVQLTKKGAHTKVDWSSEAEDAFRTLIGCLETRPVLKLPEIGKAFLVQTDASNTGVGGVLLQYEGGIRKPVSYFSKQFKASELNYSTIEKECLAIVWSIEKFQRYLYGTDFELETDHQPLQYLDRSKTLNPRLMRWAMRLQPYRFHITAIKGVDNVGADFLSRMEG